jgi:hypothetical protein
MHVVQYSEKPHPQIGARLPKALLRKRTHKAALDEIVSLPDIPGQCSGVPP